MKNIESDPAMDAAGTRLRALNPGERARHARHARVVEGLLSSEARVLRRRRGRRALAVRSAAGLGAAIAAAWTFVILRPTRDASAMQPVTFAVDSIAADRVALVGEFNGWDAGATPMTRSREGRWEVTLRVPPGRHTYAFVVDDSTWVADPAAPRAPEKWFGSARSVVVVGGDQ